MSAPELLWQVNGEYRKRLTLSITTLALLEAHLRAARAAATLCDTLRWAVDELRTLENEHRAWRHQFYYESQETKRMVQDERDVARALSTFHRLRQRQSEHLRRISDALGSIDRPLPPLTQSSSGDDLWNRAETAFLHLTGFDDFVRGLSQP